MVKHLIDLPKHCKLHSFDIIGSVNDEAKKMAEGGAPAWSILWAKAQTKGRGRSGKKWHSPVGNLFVSIILRPKAQVENLPQLSFISAIAVKKAIAEAGVEANFKWPNDILINGKKISGILLESGAVKDKRWLVVGIGINIKEFPKDADYPATSLHNEAKENKVSLERVLESLIHNMITEVDIWEKQGFAKHRQEWLDSAAGIGRSVNIKLPDGIVSGTFMGLDKTGNLELKEDGAIKKISAGQLFFSAKEMQDASSD